MSSAKSLSSMLNHNDDRLAELSRHCRLLQTIDEIVRRNLPEALATHCQVLNLSGSHLVLQTDSPAWNTTLRYQVPDLLSRLRRHPALQGLASIHIKTAPPTPIAAQRQPSSPRRLSPDAAALIQSLADTVDEPRLQAALQRFTRHHAQS